MYVTDELLRRNRTYAETFPGRDRPVAPRLHLAVVACMDSRLDLFAALGLDIGDAHVIRNAGGIVTDDVIRSLVVSQQRLGTREVVVVHHTDCGLHGLDEPAFREQLVAMSGEEPPFAFGAFADLEASVRESVGRVTASPFVAEKGSVRGFVFEVETGVLREVR